MSKRSDTLLLQDILDSIEKIESYTNEFTFDSFCNDNKTIDAVIRNFEIIGEAANRLTEDFKEKENHIEWYKIIAIRNRVIHDYMGIDYSIIWEIIQNSLPKLKTEISDLLKQT